MQDAEDDVRAETAAGRTGRQLGPFAVLFVALGCATLAGPFHDRPWASGAALLVAGAAWWLALARAGRPHARGPRLRWIILGAVFLRALGLLSEFELSDDLQRYVWEGELLRRGISPYHFAPDSPALGGVRAELAYTYAHMNNPDVSAAYPPLALATFAAVAASLHPWLDAQAAPGQPSDYERAAAWGLRLLFALADLALLLPLIRDARRRRTGNDSGVIAWAWCPLVVVEYSGAGHFDSLALLLWWCALLGLAGPGWRDPECGDRRGAKARIAASLAWAGSVLVKYLPVASLPWVLRGPGAWKRALGLGVLCALAFLPFAAFGGWTLDELGRGLGEYGLRWESNSLTYRFVESALGTLFERDGTLLDVRRVGRASIGLVWLAVVIWSFRRHREDPVAGALHVTAAFLILTPTLHPWYVTWIVPFLARKSTPAWCYLCVVAPLSYWPLQGWVERSEWVEPHWLWPVVALPFFALLAMSALGRGRSAD